MPNQLKTAVLGVSGYTGGELVRLLLTHPRLADTPPLLLGRTASSANNPVSQQDRVPEQDRVLQQDRVPQQDRVLQQDRVPQQDRVLQQDRVPQGFSLGSHRSHLVEKGGFSPLNTVHLTQLHPQLAGLPHANSLTVSPFDWSDLAGIDILFLATPHEQSRELVPTALAHGIRVVDLSGAWRLHDPANAAVYKLTDADPGLAASVQSEAIYGSPELHSEAIQTAKLVANPGCYATSVILALAPVLKAQLADLAHDIICDSKSGVSGAGKSPTPTTHFMHAADNLSAYAVFGHRHTGELLEQLHLQPSQIQFTPHLLPIPRGILSTIYVRLAAPTTTQTIQQLLDNFYANAPLVRIHKSPSLPQIQHVVRTSFCDIGFQLSADGTRLILISCLDNLLKGAASQAVQNMNLMVGYTETAGLL